MSYDKYYETQNLFGEPYPELIEFFGKCQTEGKVLDVGCGQGRDAIVLARLGFSVMGIDYSKVGIDQMIAVGKAENLDLEGEVADIYSFKRYHEFDIILLDSMFHFLKKDKEKEVGLVKKIVSQISEGSLVVVCIQDTGQKVQILNSAIDSEGKWKRLVDRKFKHTFEDQESGGEIETKYRMVVVEKLDSAG